MIRPTCPECQFIRAFKQTKTSKCEYHSVIAELRAAIRTADELAVIAAPRLGFLAHFAKLDMRLHYHLDRTVRFGWLGTVVAEQRAPGDYSRLSSADEPFITLLDFQRAHLVMLFDRLLEPLRGAAHRHISVRNTLNIYISRAVFLRETLAGSIGLEAELEALLSGGAS